MKFATCSQWMWTSGYHLWGFNWFSVSVTTKPWPISKFIFYLADFPKATEVSFPNNTPWMIGAVCALNGEYSPWSWTFQRVTCTNEFIQAGSPVSAGVPDKSGQAVPRSEASGKVVWSDPTSEGSETAKPGSNEQELNTRLVRPDEVWSRVLGRRS